MPWLEREEVLSFEEIEHLVAADGGHGDRGPPADGGRAAGPPRIPTLARCSGGRGIRDLSLTTNGYLLERDAADLAAAGIDRVNVSIDSLQRDRFFQITRRDALPQVLRGLDASRATVDPAVKVNALGDSWLHRGGDPAVLRLRPLDGLPGPLHRVHAAGRRPRLEPGSVLTGEEIRRAVIASPPVEDQPEPSATARVFRFADGRGEIGFINPVSEPFCADCNRIRLTSEGKLRTCLFSLTETDLRGPCVREPGTPSSSG